MPRKNQVAIVLSGVTCWSDCVRCTKPCGEVVACTDATREAGAHIPFACIWLSSALRKTHLYQIVIAHFNCQNSVVKWSLWIGIAVLVNILFQIYDASGDKFSKSKASSDFYKFYLSAERYQQGKGMYWRIPARLRTDDPCAPIGRAKIVHDQGGAFDPIRECLHPNLNPPAFVALTLPFSLLSYDTAWRVWSGTSIFAGLLSLWVLVRAWTPEKEQILLRFASSCVVFFFYVPTFFNYCLGQVTLLLLLPLTISWSMMRRGEEYKAGAWLGLALSIKPFFGLFAITFLLARRWKAAVALLGVASGVSLLGLIWAGWETHLEYTRVLGDVTWGATNWNASFAGFFDRLLGGSENQPWVQAPRLAKSLALIFSAIVLVFMGESIFHTRTLPKKQFFDGLYTMTIPAMLLISPLGWYYYFPLLVICVPVIWVHVKSSGSKLAIVMFVSLITITAIPRNFEPARSMSDPLSWWLDGPLYFYTILGLFILTLYGIRHGGAKWRNSVSSAAEHVLI